MKLWADACVTPTLQDVAHDRGYEGTSNRQRDKLNTLDPNLYPTVLNEDWVFITNNQQDFRKLVLAEDIHPGLIVLPQTRRAQQRQWLGEVLDYIEQHASADGEPPRDWMVCRLVLYGENGTISDEWLCPEKG